jgi:hypothetical protein
MTLRKWRKLDRDITHPHTSKDSKKRWWQRHGYDLNASLRPKYGQTSSLDHGFENYMKRHPELKTCAVCHRTLDTYSDQVVLVPVLEKDRTRVTLVCDSGLCLPRDGAENQSSPYLHGTPLKVITAYWDRMRERVKPIGKSEYLEPQIPLFGKDSLGVDARGQTTGPLDDLLANAGNHAIPVWARL